MIVEDKQTPLQEELVRQRKYWRKNHIWTVLILVAVFLYTMLTGPAISVTPGPEALKLDMPNQSVVLPYDAITDCELIEQPDFGTCVEGKDARKYQCGRWENEAWGTYTLCVYTSSKECIVIKTDTEIYVVNMASDSDTEQMFQQIGAR